MVTEPRDINSGDLAGLQNSEAFRDFDRVTVDEDLDRILGVGEMDARSADGVPRREDLILRRLGLRDSGGFGRLELWFRDDGAEEEIGGLRSEKTRSWSNRSRS